MANIQLDNEKYRSTFVTPNINSGSDGFMSTSVTGIDGGSSDDQSGRRSSSSSGSSSSGKFYRVRQLSSNSSVKDGGHIVDCRLGTDEKTGQQQVEMIFTLNPLGLPSGAVQQNAEGVEFGRASTIPPEPILFRGSESISESPVFVAERPVLTQAVGTPQHSSQKEREFNLTQAAVSPTETFSVSRFNNANKIKQKLETSKYVMVTVSELLQLDKDGRAFSVIYVGLLLACLLHYSISRLTDYSTVTNMSLLALSLGLMDLYSELICNRLNGLNIILNKSEKWNRKDEEHFDSICKHLCEIDDRCRQLLNDLSSMRRSKSKMAYINGGLILLFLAWLGSVLDGIFVIYLIGAVVVGGIQLNLRLKTHHN